MIGQDQKRELLEFDKLFGIVSQIKPFFIRNRTYPPLLHGQGAEQDFNRLTVLVVFPTLLLGLVWSDSL